MCALVTGVQTCALPICRPDGGAGLGAYVRALRRLWSDLRNRRGTDVLPGLLRRRRVAVARVFVARAGASRAGTAASSQTLSQPARDRPLTADRRSEEHTSELQSLMRISYAVFCLKKKKRTQTAHIPVLHP